MTILERIPHRLTAQAIPFEVRHHRATHTSAESAAVRGEALAVGAKAIVMI